MCETRWCCDMEVYGRVHANGRVSEICNRIHTKRPRKPRTRLLLVHPPSYIPSPPGSGSCCLTSQLLSQHNPLESLCLPRSVASSLRPSSATRLPCALLGLVPTARNITAALYVCSLLIESYSVADLDPQHRTCHHMCLRVHDRLLTHLCRLA